jgi:hypothetical protein
MKTMFLAAMAALTLGMGSAFAHSSPSASGCRPRLLGDPGCSVSSAG